jgi:hypothetical protein
MTDQSIEDAKENERNNQAFYKWADDYALDNEPLDNASRRYDCFQAYLAGMQAARQSSQSEPVAYVFYNHNEMDRCVMFANDEEAINLIKRDDLPQLTYEPLVIAAPQQAIPSGWNIGVLSKARNFIPDVDGNLLGLINGDMGYEETGIKIDMTGWTASPTAPIESDK